MEIPRGDITYEEGFRMTLKQAVTEAWKAYQRFASNSDHTAAVYRYRGTDNYTVGEFADSHSYLTGANEGEILDEVLRLTAPRHYEGSSKPVRLLLREAMADAEAKLAELRRAEKFYASFSK